MANELQQYSGKASSETEWVDEVKHGNSETASKIAPTSWKTRAADGDGFKYSMQGVKKGSEIYWY